VEVAAVVEAVAEPLKLAVQEAKEETEATE
jgi:hypothetical protein